jgi:hypothetical protein
MFTNQYRTVGPQSLDVVPHNKIRMILRVHIVRIFSDHLAARNAEKLLGSSIDQGEDIRFVLAPLGTDLTTIG